ncbi:hypothetical protein GQX73_g9149 [Xylaria multiplex]|uniref:Uncharacterized protein n=1 Tax=Xylaria multiplex TaxID=323545 RepID=A0A7C8IN93_9PEZI|nr:hypothetical protein GQX73_g9149 [Xylaria multiplex]
MCIYRKSLFLFSVQSEFRSSAKTVQPKKTTLDRKLSDVKEKIAELKIHLNDTYGDCLKHVKEAGLELETKPEDEGNPKNGEDAKPKKIDPVQAFLDMKMKEEHAHLMMLGGSKGK